MAMQIQNAVEQGTNNLCRLALTADGIYVIGGDNTGGEAWGSDSLADADLRKLARGTENTFIAYPDVEQTEYDQHTLRVKSTEGDFRFSFPDTEQEQVDALADTLLESLQIEREVS